MSSGESFSNNNRNAFIRSVESKFDVAFPFNTMLSYSVVNWEGNKFTRPTTQKDMSVCSVMARNLRPSGAQCIYIMESPSHT